MNGPQHYRMAERLERVAIDQWEHEQFNIAARLTMPQAQLHATLALAAATADPMLGHRPGLDKEWQEAIK